MDFFLFFFVSVTLYTSLTSVSLTSKLLGTMYLLCLRKNTCCYWGVILHRLGTGLVVYTVKMFMNNKL